MTLSARDWLEKIRALPLQRRVRIMNVCGGHERSITMAGLRVALPQTVELIPGPGCPVCVCPEEDVYLAIRLALHAGVILVAFGDMLRVPVNVPRSEPRSLEQAKAAGADIRPVASPQEAVKIASENPQRQVVFFVAGFETTTAPVAAMLLEDIPDNLFLLLSCRLTWPAVAMLLNSGSARFRCLGRARPCRHGDGPGGMGIRRRTAWHPSRGCRLYTGVAARGDVFGIAPTARSRMLSRQLLPRSGAPRRQCDGTSAACPGDACRRCELARHRHHPGVGL